MGRGTDARPRCHAARHSDLARRRGVTRRQAGGTSEPLPPPRPSPREARRRRAARRLGNSRGRSSSVCPTQPHVGSGIRDDPTRPASPTVLLVSRPALGARVQPPPIVILPTTSSASVIRPWAASPAVAASNRIPILPPAPATRIPDANPETDATVTYQMSRRATVAGERASFGSRVGHGGFSSSSPQRTMAARPTRTGKPQTTTTPTSHCASLGQGSRGPVAIRTVPGPDEWRLWQPPGERGQRERRGARGHGGLERNVGGELPSGSRQ